MTGTIRLFVCLSFLGLWLRGGGSTPAGERPNIVLVMADDLGFSDLGCYGGEIATPNLDGLAAEGMRFTQFYNNAKCTQTRASLLSGLYHQQTKNLKENNHVTIAEVLRVAGYTTLMSGKWHVAKTPPERGFDRYFGFLSGAVNFFTGMDYATGKNLMRLDAEVFKVPSSGFYTTDAFTDYAIEFLDEASRKDKPFFLYLAHNAPHFPLHALPEDVAKYRGKYLKGWDALRAERHARMVRMGVIDPHWALSPRDAIVPAWDTLSRAEQQQEDLLMAVYAAMVDRLDQNMGRLLARLDRLGVAENTVVIFLSDNGACPYDFNDTPDLPPGPAESYRTYNSPWANAGNTPFRLYKQWSHEGGVSTPLIVRWPGRIEAAGTFSDQLGHVIDLMPTCVELAGADYPRRFNGHAVLPTEGISLVPALTGDRGRRDDPVFWEYKGNRAVRIGKWKLVAERSNDWELYDVKADRCESSDLVQQQPERTAAMARLFDDWAERVGAESNETARSAAPSTQPR